MTHISLSFSNHGSIQLERVDFEHPYLREPRRSIRGKTKGAWAGYHSFQWTFAVQALSLLLLKTKALDDASTSSAPPLVGGAGTAAASLDLAISKQPLWLLDMFGIDGQGECLIRRLVNRTNPERRRGGDVAIAIKEHQLHKDQIDVRLDGTLVAAREEILRIAHAIEQLFQPSHAARQAREATVGVSLFEAPDGFDRSILHGFCDEILLGLADLPEWRPILMPKVTKARHTRCDLLIIGRITSLERRFQLCVHLVQPRTGSVHFSRAYRGETKALDAVERQVAADVRSVISKHGQEPQAVAG